MYHVNHVDSYLCHVCLIGETVTSKVQVNASMKYLVPFRCQRLRSNVSPLNQPDSYKLGLAKPEMHLEVNNLVESVIQCSPITLGLQIGGLEAVDFFCPMLYSDFAHIPTHIKTNE